LETDDPGKEETGDGQDGNEGDSAAKDGKSTDEMGEQQRALKTDQVGPGSGEKISSETQTEPVVGHNLVNDIMNLWSVLLCKEQLFVLDLAFAHTDLCMDHSQSMVTSVRARHLALASVHSIEYFFLV
jgi:hypothetical protein